MIISWEFLLNDEKEIKRYILTTCNDIKNIDKVEKRAIKKFKKQIKNIIKNNNIDDKIIYKIERIYDNKKIKKSYSWCDYYSISLMTSIFTFLFLTTLGKFLLN